MRILIAEDDCTSRTVLSEVLKKQGHEVVAAANGAEAWAVLQQPDAPALAILDWMMPEMDGLEVVRRIRALQTDRPPYLIMLTAKGGKSDSDVGLRAGVNDYLAKPVDPGLLLACIEVGRRAVAMQGILTSKAEELYQVLEHVKTLRGIVPICANCNKIRDDQCYWNQEEFHARDHLEAEFYHGLCPECVKRLYADSEQDGSPQNRDCQHVAAGEKIRPESHRKCENETCTETPAAPRRQSRPQE